MLENKTNLTWASQIITSGSEIARTMKKFKFSNAKMAFVFRRLEEIAPCAVEDTDKGIAFIESECGSQIVLFFCYPDFASAGVGAALFKWFESNALEPATSRLCLKPSEAAPGRSLRMGFCLIWQRYYEPCKKVLFTSDLQIVRLSLRCDGHLTCNKNLYRRTSDDHKEVFFCRSWVGISRLLSIRIRSHILPSLFW